jgi:hypothetical protein
MIGIVEIYKNFGTPQQELLIKENNLVVDGAGETLCDLWTTPSGAVSAVPHLIDASNYSIQAISFGKGGDAYKKNTHFFPLHPSSYAASAANNVLPYYSYVNLVKSDNIIRAVSLKNQNIGPSTSSYDPLCDVGTTPNVTDKQLEPDTRTAIDVAAGEAHLMNSVYMQGRAHPYGHNLNRLVSNTNPNLLSFTTNPTSDVWDIGTYVSSFTLGNETTGPFWGTSALVLSGGADANAVIRQDVSGGGSTPGGPYDTSNYARQKRYFTSSTDHTFSVYVKLGETAARHPESVTLNMKADKLYDGTGQNHKIVFNKVGGTLGNPAYLEISTEQNASGGVETLGVGATDFQIGWQRIHCRVEGLGAATAGEYIRPMLFFTASDEGDAELEIWNFQLEESYGPSPPQTVSGISPSFDEGGLPGDLFLGCYPDTSGTKYAIVDDLTDRGLDDLDGLNLEIPNQGVIASGIYPFSSDEDFFNLSSLRSMDKNGFIKSYNALLDDIPLIGDATANSNARLMVSALSDFSSTGEVTYQCTISSGDLGTANMYGGLFKCGLWTIDVEKTLAGDHPTDQIKYPQTPPFMFKAGSNRLVYRLFSEKSFTYNLARIQDNQTDAGCTNYEPLTLIWRVKFL